MRTLVKLLVLPVAAMAALLIGYVAFIHFGLVERFSTTAVMDMGGAAEVFEPVTTEIFNATISTLYALIVAFVIFKGMQDYEHANHALQDEAMQIRTLSNSLKYFESNEAADAPPTSLITDPADRLRWLERNRTSVESIRSELIFYVQALSEAIRGRKAEVPENMERLDACAAHVGDLVPMDENDKLALGAMMRTLCDVSSIRARRIALMKTKLSPYLMIILVVLTLLIIAPFFVAAGPFDDLRAQGLSFLEMVQALASRPEFVAIGGLGFSLTYLFFLMLDMNSPFNGHWRVKTTPLTEIEQELSAHLASAEPER